MVGSEEEATGSEEGTLTGSAAKAGARAEVSDYR